jgi:hypothetical protein
MQPTSSQSPVSAFSKQALGEKKSHLLLVSFGDSKTTWVAHPENTNTTTPAAFTTGGSVSPTNLLAIANTDSITSPVIFTTSNGTSGTDASVPSNTAGTSAPLTDVWTLYGNTVILNQTNADFYAQPTGKDGWYILLWGSTDQAAVGNTPVTVRTIAPASG